MQLEVDPFLDAERRTSSTSPGRGPNVRRFSAWAGCFSAGIR